MSVGRKATVVRTNHAVRRTESRMVNSEEHSIASSQLGHPQPQNGDS